VEEAHDMTKKPDAPVDTAAVDGVEFAPDQLGERVRHLDAARRAAATLARNSAA
jgi:hypothetical protein